MVRSALPFLTESLRRLRPVVSRCVCQSAPVCALVVPVCCERGLVYEFFCARGRCRETSTRLLVHRRRVMTTLFALAAAHGSLLEAATRTSPVLRQVAQRLLWRRTALENGACLCTALVASHLCHWQFSCRRTLLLRAGPRDRGCAFGRREGDGAVCKGRPQQHLGLSRLHLGCTS